MDTNEHAGTASGPKRVLVIDDSELDRMMLEELLKQAGYQVSLAADGDEGLQAYLQNPFDLVITDMVMPGKMGIDVILELKRKFPDVKVIAMSAGGDFGPEIELDMARELAAHTIQKPFDPDMVLQMAARLLSQ